MLGVALLEAYTGAIALGNEPPIQACPFWQVLQLGRQELLTAIRDASLNVIENLTNEDSLVLNRRPGTRRV